MDKEQPNDFQIGGDHYLKTDLQPWDVMKAWLSPEEFQGFLVGNIIKYIARYKLKGGRQDLQKASHYLSKLIEITK